MRKIIVFLLTVLLLAACGSEQEARSDHKEEHTDTASVMFRGIDVKVEGNQMHLIGEAKASGNELYYELSQGKKILQKETMIALDEEHLGWSEFDIASALPDNVADEADTPIVMLYVKGDNGRIVNPNYIPVDVLNH